MHQTIAVCRECGTNINVATPSASDNSRYVTALDVYNECVASGEFVIGQSFGDWCKERLNAEEPHCT